MSGHENNEIKHERNTDDIEAENKRLKAELKEISEREYELRKKNEELECFADRISHDMRNNIAVIKRIFELAEDDDSFLIKYRRTVIDIVNRISNQIKMMLELSKAGKDIKEMRFFELEPILRSIFEGKKFVSNFDVEIKLNYSSENDSPSFFGDPLSIAQVFSVVLDNAFDYMDPEKKSLFIEVGFNNFKGYFEIWFKDNGIGIEKEFIDKVFDIYFTTRKKDHQGTGLYMAKKLVGAHNGEITAASDGTGMGTQITIRFPEI